MLNLSRKYLLVVYSQIQILFFSIKDRKRQVLDRRQAVKNLAQARYNALLASKNYQVFSAEVEDFNNWCTEKMKTATDDSYKDLSNLERKLQKHEAFERELRANEGQLRNVNKVYFII